MHWRLSLESLYPGKHLHWKLPTRFMHSPLRHTSCSMHSSTSANSRNITQQRSVEKVTRISRERTDAVSLTARQLVSGHARAGEGAARVLADYVVADAGRSLVCALVDVLAGVQRRYIHEALITLTVVAVQRVHAATVATDLRHQRALVHVWYLKHSVNQNE